MADPSRSGVIPAVRYIGVDSVKGLVGVNVSRRIESCDAELSDLADPRCVERSSLATENAFVAVVVESGACWTEMATRLAVGSQLAVIVVQRLDETRAQFLTRTRARIAREKLELGCLAWVVSESRGTGLKTLGTELGVAVEDTLVIKIDGSRAASTSAALSSEVRRSPMLDADDLGETPAREILSGVRWTRPEAAHVSLESDTTLRAVV